MNEEIKLRENLKKEYNRLKDLRKIRKDIENFEMEIGTEEEYIQVRIDKWKETDLLRDEVEDPEVAQYIESIDKEVDFSKSPEVDPKLFKQGLSMLVTDFEAEHNVIDWAVSGKEVVITSRNSKIEVPISVIINFVDKLMMNNVNEYRERISIQW